ncbi:MAG: hypothetical protein ACHP7N_17895 [Caulobacterales bacterium]
MRDRSLQFSFDKAPPDPKLTPTPHWLVQLGHWIEQASRLLGWVFWAGVIIAAALLLYFIGREIVRTRWPDRFGAKASARPAIVDWRPDETAARALLEEADRLAAEGAYAEAVHLLLHRSIEHIGERRPRLVKPANTAREIAGLQGIPEAASATFAAIAGVVETSFFGGRAVDAVGFAECRQAYEAFAFPGAWA